jgi:hypothetical protein
MLARHTGTKKYPTMKEGPDREAGFDSYE